MLSFFNMKTFSTESVLEAKFKNCAFRNIPNLSICWNSITLNINFKSDKRGFQGIKIYSK